MAKSRSGKFPTHPLRSAVFQNLLSFGPEQVRLELKPLNVLIGPNASGKSNLIDAIELLQAVPTSLQKFFAEHGPASDWVWKGTDAVPAYIGLEFNHPAYGDLLTYKIGFSGKERFQIWSEKLEIPTEAGKRHRLGPYKFFDVEFQKAVLYAEPSYAPQEKPPESRVLRPEERNEHESLLSQLKDPGQHPEITYTGKLLDAFAAFTEWEMGRYSSLRRPQPSDLPTDFVLKDCSNLTLVLNDLEHRGMKPIVVQHLQKLYAEPVDYSVRAQGGSLQLFFAERGLADRIPASRLSDGTLRFLCLIAILCHPDPPPLVCIEEPELGMHPDVLPAIAEMMVDASSRCQLIVTTHSPELIDALSGTPESVVVCERTEAGTEMKRLDAERLQKWLVRYRLGELWQKGEIGGTRW